MSNCDAQFRNANVLAIQGRRH